MVDTNCLEVKTIAGFLNYKICRLMFRSVPRDAIAHFKAHIERFRGRTGFREIMFEHYAWLSFQYSAFAELFCDAIKLGLAALQAQNPGIYYYKAAEYMGQRKQMFYECLATAAAAVAAGATGSAVSTPADALNASYANQFYSEFFGVRTTKIGDAATEQQQFALVQANEMNFNHSVWMALLMELYSIKSRLIDIVCRWPSSPFWARRWHSSKCTDVCGCARSWPSKWRRSICSAATTRRP